MNDKPCKLCSKKRYANTSWCYSHYLERERTKKAEKAAKKLESKKKTKKYQKSLYKIVKRKAWKLMSEIVRRTGVDDDGFNSCYTCGKRLHWKELHAGHFHHGKLDFNKRNLRPQCAGCNTYRGGEGQIYATRLVQEGEDLTALELLANTTFYKTDDIIELIPKLQKELDELNK